MHSYASPRPLAYLMELFYGNFRVIEAVVIVYISDIESMLRSFFTNSRNARTPSGYFHCQKAHRHEFIIYATRERTRADNFLYNCTLDNLLYNCKKQIEISSSRVCPVIDNEIRHNIVSSLLL